ncbi:MAG: hypothetical protein FJ187_04015 [Gammaproteobacteria bacterium]|nr:hypothetical protein [Gammaproteobacteria bacterium]
MHRLIGPLAQNESPSGRYLASPNSQAVGLQLSSISSALSQFAPLFAKLNPAIRVVVLSELGHITMITGDQSVDAAELSTANFL